jgi:hypothetical protein
VSRKTESTTRAAGPRRRGGRYAPRYEPVELLTIVREITTAAASAAGSDPLRTTTRAYDAARAGSPYPESPRADQIIRFFKQPWRRIVEVSHLTGRDFQMNLVVITRRERRPFTLEEAAAAVRAVAKRLEVRTLRPAEYDRELDRLIEEQRRSWLHGRRVWDDYPSSERIEWAHGWARVVEEAGLEPPPQPPQLPQQPGGTWTCERCIDSLLTALEEHELSHPGEKLTQRAYQRMKKGRLNLAPAGALTRAAKRMGMTVSEQTRELVAWRLGARDQEPALLERARQADARWSVERAGIDYLRSARIARRERRDATDQELLDAIRQFKRPASRAEIAEEIGWTTRKTGARLQRLRRLELVEKTNTGHGNKSVRWKAADQGA